MKLHPSLMRPCVECGGPAVPGKLYCANHGGLTSYPVIDPPQCDLFGPLGSTPISLDVERRKRRPTSLRDRARGPQKPGGVA